MSTNRRYSQYVAEDGPATITDMLDMTVDRVPNKEAIRQKVEGVWKAWTWEEYRADVRTAARALMKLGLQKGKGVAIIGFNCPQWFISDLATIHVGGVVAGIYTTASPEQAHYITHHCEAQVAFVEDQDQLAKFLKVWKKLPELKSIVLMNGSSSAKNVYSWDAFMALGKFNENDEKALALRVSQNASKQLCMLIYTSGTTGNPKGVMLGHQQIVWTTRVVTQMLGIGADDHIISYLPLSHIAEQMVSCMSPLYTGATTHFAMPDALRGSLKETIKEVRPTVFLGVPRVWEKFAAAAKVLIEEHPKRKTLEKAMVTGLKAGLQKQRGEKRGLKYQIYKKLVFAKLKERLGFDRCRYYGTAAAPISKETLLFFLSINIPIFEIYGMSECCGPQTITTKGNHKTGWVGKAIPGTELKIDKDSGEICYRGPHIMMGYYKEDEKTRAAIDKDGWLHSGDVGELDKDGFLKITDRLKELVITAAGENIAPAPIEGELRGVPGISQAMYVGDKQKTCVVLITIDEVALDKLSKTTGCPKTAKECVSDAKFNAYIKGQIDRINSSLARVQTIKDFRLLDKDWTPEGEEAELTPTMKLKRRVVLRKYEDSIKEMYGSDYVKP